MTNLDSGGANFTYAGTAFGLDAWGRVIGNNSFSIAASAVQLCQSPLLQINSVCNGYYTGYGNVSAPYLISAGASFSLNVTMNHTYTMCDYTSYSLSFLINSAANVPHVTNRTNTTNTNTYTPGSNMITLAGEDQIVAFPLNATDNNTHMTITPLIQYYDSAGISLPIGTSNSVYLSINSTVANTTGCFGSNSDTTCTTIQPGNFVYTQSPTGASSYPWNLTSANFSFVGTYDPSDPCYAQMHQNLTTTPDCSTPNPSTLARSDPFVVLTYCLNNGTTLNHPLRSYCPIWPGAVDIRGVQQNGTFPFRINPDVPFTVVFNTSSVYNIYFVVYRAGRPCYVDTIQYSFAVDLAPSISILSSNDAVIQGSAIVFQSNSTNLVPSSTGLRWDLTMLSSTANVSAPIQSISLLNPALTPDYQSSSLLLTTSTLVPGGYQLKLSAFTLTSGFVRTSCITAFSVIALPAAPMCSVSPTLGTEVTTQFGIHCLPIQGAFSYSYSYLNSAGSIIPLQTALTPFPTLNNTLLPAGNVSNGNLLSLSITANVSQIIGIRSLNVSSITATCSLLVNVTAKPAYTNSTNLLNDVTSLTSSIPANSSTSGNNLLSLQVFSTQIGSISSTQGNSSASNVLSAKVLNLHRITEQELM